jgi:hypothetical protein
MKINLDLDATLMGKPLAGNCVHRWQDVQSPFLLAQLCTSCKLFRYKVALMSDWEYRAPIPRLSMSEE